MAGQFDTAPAKRATSVSLGTAGAVAALLGVRVFGPGIGAAILIGGLMCAAGVNYQSHSRRIAKESGESPESQNVYYLATFALGMGIGTLGSGIVLLLGALLSG